MDNVISSAKTDMFRIRMNPEIREELEQIYAKTGLTLTDAINVFFQQSLNAGGFPFAPKAILPSRPGLCWVLLNEN